MWVNDAEEWTLAVDLTEDFSQFIAANCANGEMVSR